LSGPQLLVVLDELDGFDPLDLLEPEFVLAAETERRAVINVERLPVHFVSQQRQLMLHVAKSVDVVIPPSVSPVGVAVEYDVFSSRVRLHPFQEFCHRSSAPLGNAAPALNAVMLRDLFTEADFTQLIDRELLGMRNFAKHLQRAALWALLQKAVPKLALGEGAVGPDMWGDVAFLVLRVGRKPFHQERYAAHDQAANALNQARMVHGDPGRGNPHEDNDADADEPPDKAVPGPLVRPQHDAVEVCSEACDEHHA